MVCNFVYVVFIYIHWKLIITMALGSIVETVPPHSAEYDLAEFDLAESDLT